MKYIEMEKKIGGGRKWGKIMKYNEGKGEKRMKKK